MDMEKKYVVVKNGVRVSNALSLNEAQELANKVRLTESAQPTQEAVDVQIVEFLLG